MSANAPASEREIAITRTINGPRRLVFQAWTKVEHLSQWWGPDGFTTTTHAFEFRPGGVWEFTMHAPDGTDYPNHIQWLEIDPPHRIVAHHGTHAGDPDAFVTTVTMAKQGDGVTEITLRTVFPTRERRDRAVEEYRAVEGGRQTLSSLDEYVTAQTGATP